MEVDIVHFLVMKWNFGRALDYLFQCWLFADKYEKYEGTSGEVQTAENSEEDFWERETVVNIRVITMQEVVKTLEDPENPQNCEELDVEDLE